MKKGKLEILADIQTECENVSMNKINLMILVLKTTKFMSSKFFGFLVATLSVVFGLSLSIFIGGASVKNLLHPVSLLIFVIAHLIIFKLYNRKSDKDLEIDEEVEYSLECMKEIKKNKLETK